MNSQNAQDLDTRQLFGLGHRIEIRGFFLGSRTEVWFVSVQTLVKSLEGDALGSRVLQSVIRNQKTRVRVSRSPKVMQFNTAPSVVRLK
jgi:hypothetical protein